MLGYYFEGWDRKLSFNLRYFDSCALCAESTRETKLKTNPEVSSGAQCACGLFVVHDGSSMHQVARLCCTKMDRTRPRAKGKVYNPA